MENRCPNCGAPLPLGSEICFDCGTRIPRSEWEPWEQKDRTNAEKNTGERTWQRDQARQRRHERRHTAHSTSREAGRDYEKEKHTYQTFRTVQAKTRQTGTKTTHAPQTAKKKKSLSLTLLCVALAIFMAVSVWEDSGGRESTPETAAEYILYDNCVVEIMEDGSSVEMWYDSDDALVEENYIDAEGTLAQTNIYVDGRVAEEWYYDEEGDLIGEVYRDEDGTISHAWGTDRDGTDLETLSE